RRLYALRLLCRACPWGRTTGEGHHPFIRLHHTGRTHPTRLKREAYLQGAAGLVLSTSHAALLAPVVSGSPEPVASGAVPRATRPHNRGAVVSVEYSSRTLPVCWQLCRKCNDSPLWSSCHGFLYLSTVHNSGT